MAKPLCPYFGICGGCAMQHVDYSVQLENKRKTLERALESVRSLGSARDDKRFHIQVFSGSEYFYRNRMDFVFHPQGVGFRRKGDWRVIIPIDRCVISNERLNALLKEVNTAFADVESFDNRRRVGTFRYAIVRTPAQESSITFVLNKDSTRVGEAVSQIEAFAKTTTANHVLVVYVGAHSGADVSDDYFVVKGSEWLRGGYLGRTFSFAIQGFYQTNDAMAEKMQEYVHELLKKYDTQNAYLLDLYGGVGTFGIINAPLFKWTTVVESVPQCIEAAKRNAAENGVKNINAEVLDAKRLKNLTFQSPLYVINDPPRSGMHEKTIEELKRLKPKVMIYVSCNAEQLGKDLPKFKDYKLKSAALFDLFPHTNHMESVVELAFFK
ncbi:MAG: 23S rRNA (uracil(1939)-C(5))-methyltransferase RlmD [Candidatus Peregrinibacteria bacterium]